MRMTPTDSWRESASASQSGSEPSPHGEAMLRAYGFDRAVDYGMALDDMLRVDARVRAGAEWADVLEHLASDHLRRAEIQSGLGQMASASSFYLHAAACLRLAQAGCEEDPPRRLSLYERQALAFAHGVSCSGLNAHAMALSFRDAAHQAWLVQPPVAHAPPPCVLVWGGADGWCEAFWRSVPSFLERGLAVCLVELPGQGLARLRGGSYLRTDFTQLVSLAIDTLGAAGIDARRMGVIGHSMGGTLAMAAASADERIRACVNNGGVLEREATDPFPRATRRVGAMLGPDGNVNAFYASLGLPAAARSMQADLLCVQGGKDVLVPDAQARRAVELRGAGHARLAYWPEGVHCIYNHALERNCLVADWLAATLIPAR